MNNSEYLILGATGSIGSAVVETLLKRDRQTSIFVRDRRKAVRLFGETAKIEIIEGDALRPGDVKKAAEGKRYILLGINYPYHRWRENMEAVTRNVLMAATANNATVLFPGNIYNFGMLTPIHEDSPPEPVAKKGHIRLKLEQMLKTAADAGQCEVINLRLPDFYGPNVTNGLMKPVFENALAGKPMQWLVRTDIPHQLVYIRDAGELFVRLAELEGLSAYEVFNFGGITVKSVKDWFKDIAKIAGVRPRVKTLPKFAISLLSPFVPIVREIKEMAYLFENAILLNDDKLKQRLPDFKPTDMDITIRETLDWFKKHLA